MGRFQRFGSELKRILKNIGNATEKTLKSLDNPQFQKMDQDLERLIKKY